MEQQRGTNGAVYIELAANGFIVTLPPKMTNPYSTLGAQLRPVMREMREEDDEIAQLQRQGEQETPPVEAGYDMMPLGNVYTFHTWEAVLSFLADQLDPVPVNDRR